MKKYLIVFLALVSSIQVSNALDANISFGTFNSKSGSYIEVYLEVVGSTAEFISITDSTVMANIEVIILFKQGGEITKFDKYMLNSPSLAEVVNFVDAKRYALGKGEYEIEVSLRDINKDGNEKQFKKEFAIDFSKPRIYQSDIQLVASLRKVEASSQGANHMEKGGYIFEPLPSQFFDKFCDKLIFYNEIYQTDSLVGEDFMVSYFIQEIVGEEKGTVKKLMHKRKSSDAVVAILQQIDIADLPSGNYSLAVEVKNKNGELLSKKEIALQRSNPYLNASRETIAAETNSLNEEFVAELTIDELRYSLKAIAMQVDDSDGDLLNTIIAEEKREAMELYLFSFWARENPVNPHSAYLNYMEVAKAIDDKFRSGFGFGFETDRGYVYMKYGVPSDLVAVEDEQSAPPYEIWFYNQFPQTGQNNVKFVFYNPNLATNGFIMLHSTARGERNNPRWEVDLYGNSPNDLDGGNFIDGTRVLDKMGRQARRIYESF